MPDTAPTITNVIDLPDDDGNFVLSDGTLGNPGCDECGMADAIIRLNGVYLCAGAGPLAGHPAIAAGDVLPNGYRVIEVRPAEFFGGSEAVAVLAYNPAHPATSRYAVWYANVTRPDSTTSGFYSPDLGDALGELIKRSAS